MEKANKRIIHENAVIIQSINSELEKLGDAYGRYHLNNADLYGSFSDRFNEILGFTGDTIDEFNSYVASIDLTPEQKRALVELRKEPLFKRLMGETALQQKPELESLLGSKITDAGMIFADENGAYRAIKTEQQIDQEFEGFNYKLSQLLSDGTITEQQYDDYSQNLDYIYSYYISRSKGEQVRFRKLTDAQYEQIKERAWYNDVDFYEQLRNENEYLMYEHEELQELQSSAMKSSAMKSSGMKSSGMRR